jgi:hypothetical protein
MRICLRCREPFTRDRRPWESRRLRDYTPGPHTELRVTAWGHVCQPCAQRENEERRDALRDTDPMPRLHG